MEKNVCVREEEVLLVNGTPITLEGEEGRAIKVKNLTCDCSVTRSASSRCRVCDGRRNALALKRWQLITMHS